MACYPQHPELGQGPIAVAPVALYLLCQSQNNAVSQILTVLELGFVLEPSGNLDIGIPVVLHSFPLPEGSAPLWLIVKVLRPSREGGFEPKLNSFNSMIEQNVLSFKMWN
jgi:hypothetical protein